MDTKQIEYIIKIAEEENITRAAEKLYITQSALNQQLLRLEGELGTTLFVRSKSDWHPTEAGTIYLRAAREILQIKRQAYNKISDIAQTRKGRLSIAFTPGRGIDMFTHVYPTFHQKYPNIIVEPHELSVRKQQTGIQADRIDLGFQTLTKKQYTKDEYIVLGKEEIILIVPKNHSVAMQYTDAWNGLQDYAHVKEAADRGKLHFPELDPCLLKDDFFVLTYKESTIRSIVDSLFKQAGFQPNILFETGSHSAILSMVQSGQSCGVVPYHYVREPVPAGIRCFSFPQHPTWDIVVSYKKKSYLGRAAREFIQLAKSFWGL